MKAVVAIDLAQHDQSASEEQPEERAGALGTGKWTSGLDLALELFACALDGSRGPD